MNHVEITFLGSEIFERSGRSLFFGRRTVLEPGSRVSLLSYAA
jgi:hypothetical protein